ncbi:MAG: TonB-dependent receptor [Candidatus Latescibacterota bacterium]
MPKLPTLCLTLLMTACWAAAQHPGRVTGTVVDSQSGDPLVGATVLIEGTHQGAICDLEGAFRILQVVPGAHVLVCTMIGYQKVRVVDVVVQPGEATALEIALQPEAIVLDEEVVVQARKVRNTGATLLKERQKAAAVSDAISADEISRAGSGDAAEAMAHVTGASVVGGQYVYIRGLGDRYASVQLNGIELPSADPNKRAVPMDLLPASLLDNIVTTKSFTPDQPGSFTGGSVNVGTRSYPDRLTLSVSASGAYNAQTTFQDQFLTYDGGNRDWLGVDDGTRRLPEAVANGAAIPDIGSAWKDREAALALESLSKSFTPTMAPRPGSAPVNYSGSASLGSQVRLFGLPLGFLATVTHTRSHSFYDDGTSARWQLTSRTSETLNNDFLLRDTHGTEKVSWGSLLTASYKLAPSQELGFTYMLNHNAEDEARYLAGTFPRDLEPDAVYETRVLHFTERQLRSAQLTGRHQFAPLHDARLEWSGSLATTTQDEPDLRYFTDNYVTTFQPARDENGNHLRDENGQPLRRPVTRYSIRPDIYPVPTRYFRSLEETNREAKVDLALPLRTRSGRTATFQVGGLVVDKERRFAERRYELRQDDIRYDGQSLSFFSDANVGIVDSTGGSYRFGTYVRDNTQLSGSYDGDEQVYATYAMVELPLTTHLRAVGGARLEATRTDVASRDPSKTPGHLSANDLLPALGLVHELRPGTNLRASYGRTLARPTFRELAPYASFDFVGAFEFVGNEKLKRTLVDNYDLRWERFGTPGEIWAVSLFYKGFHDPIERAIQTINGEVQFQNVDEARVAGLELEMGQGLGRLAPALGSVHLGANLSLVHSQVSVPRRELQIRRSLVPDASGRRPLQGQSPYVLNLDVAYDNLGGGLAAGLYYHHFGRRLAEVSLGGTPNVYEEGRGGLDYTLSKTLWHVYRLKLTARNLLDPQVRLVYPFMGRNYVAHSYSTGRSYSLSLGYTVGG